MEPKKKFEDTFRLSTAVKSAIEKADSRRAEKPEGTDGSVLAELIAALEAADGPGERLFSDVFSFFHPRPVEIWEIQGETWTDEYSRYQNLSLEFHTLIEAGGYTDAALTLAPDKWEWAIDNCMASNFGEIVYRVCFGERINIEHPYLAIAICIAALKARSQDKEPST